MRPLVRASTPASQDGRGGATLVEAVRARVVACGGAEHAASTHFSLGVTHGPITGPAPTDRARKVALVNEAVARRVRECTKKTQPDVHETIIKDRLNLSFGGQSADGTGNLDVANRPKGAWQDDFLCGAGRRRPRPEKTCPFRVELTAHYQGHAFSSAYGQNKLYVRQSCNAFTRRLSTPAGPAPRNQPLAEPPLAATLPDASPDRPTARLQQGVSATARVTSTPGPSYTTAGNWHSAKWSL